MEDRQFTPSGQRDEQTKEACSKEKGQERRSKMRYVTTAMRLLCVCVSMLSRLSSCTGNGTKPAPGGDEIKEKPGKQLLHAHNNSHGVELPNS